MGFLKLRSLLKLNMRFFLDYEFLRDGRFNNVVSGQTNLNGAVVSRLLCDTEGDDLLTDYENGQIWQSAFRNWVYESGVVMNDDYGIRDLTPPVIASGVYIEGAFRATDPLHPDYDAAYAHHIDFINGRIIFDNVLSLDTEIHTDFAFKHVRIDFEDALHRELDEGYLESEYATNPLTSNNIIYPSGGLQPFPGVFLETRGRRWDSYEMGNRSLIANDRMVAHIWARHSMDRDDIADIIAYQARKRIPLIDFNLAPLPLSGILHELSPNYIPYQELLNNPTISIVGSTYSTASTVGYVSDFDEVETINDEPYQRFERARVDFVVKTVQYHPNGPLGINTGSYQFKGGNENF